MRTLRFFAATVLLLFVSPGMAQIPRPGDAPKALSPGESARQFRLPPGYGMEILASEPLINEPTGVCWDEHGRLFVCELHGYNLEGQHDIDELNKTGKLDLEVRRIHASEEAKRRAAPETYGTVKLLIDSDGDGVMDRAEEWGGRLPPCYGLVPARGGIIVACAPDIVFLKDNDGDGRAEVRETLFTGFATGGLERGVNNPTWGEDDWLYFGRGWPGGTITGPHLEKPVTLPASDFRIRADGSAIEPVSGSTKTIGMTFTAGGDRFVTDTTHSGMFVTPIPWRYLARNPDAAAPLLDSPASDEIKVFPAAAAHPWRIKREQHAEYYAFYRKFSLSDAAASGYFTATCGPLVYRDSVLPGLQGHYLACESAQNFVHRAAVVRDGTRLRLQRVKGEEQSEFLASRDPWFHPVSLAHTPDGCVAIVDFYREIIEDYSAIPRHLQQQYGLINGRDRGRIWKLAPTAEHSAPTADMAPLDEAALVSELGSALYWRRRTAQRLLEERGQLPADFYLGRWKQEDPDGKVIALRAADGLFETAAKEIEAELLSGTASRQATPQVALQIALSLGESRSPRVSGALADVARLHGDLAWMDAAIASSASGREMDIFADLARNPGKGVPVMVNLAGIVAGRGDAGEIGRAIACLESAGIAGKPMEVLKLGLEETKPLVGVVPAPEPLPPTVEQNAAWEKRVPQVMAALKQPPNLEEGRLFFQAICGSCHRSHGLGVAVGPDLDGEFQRAPEVILRDILFPSEAARAGYETMMVKTQRGETLFGITASDSPTSLTLRLPGGSERTVLRKRASIRTLHNISLMTPGLGESLPPAQIANIIAFLRSAP